GAWMFFWEPAPQENVTYRSSGRVFKDMILVFGNLRFISFLVIFSGFWIMFWQIYFLLPFYSTEVLHYENFELLTIVDAFCIIFFTVPMAELVKSWKPINAITLGFVFATLCWLLIGLFPSVPVAILA